MFVDSVIPQSLLATLALVLGTLVTAFTAVALSTTGWRAFRERQRSAALIQGREILAGALVDGGIGPEDELFLRGLTRRQLVHLFVDLAPSLGGDSRLEIRDLADTLGLQALGEELAVSRLWWRRLRGARLLTAVGGGVELAHALARDPVAAVRAQAAEWYAEHTPETAAEELARLLDDPDPLCRFAAKHGLLSLKTVAVPAIQARLSSEDARTRESALEVASGTPHPAFVAPALALTRAPDPRVRVGAAGLLARLGGQTAAERLRALLADADEDVRVAAASGLARLGEISAAGDLARALVDPAWDVRRTAAEALHALGSPGELLLRRAARGSGVAAEVARLVLAAPDASVSPNR